MIMYKGRTLLSLALFIVIHILSDGFSTKNGAEGFSFCKHNDSTYQLVNNGYENVVAWIGRDVPEDFQLVVKLEELLIKFSTTLFRLTKRRAYLRHVQILIPNTWGSPPPNFSRQISNRPSNIETQSQAQIWIKNSSPRTENNQTRWVLGDHYAHIVQPYVIKTTPCGFPGSYLRMSPEFVRFGEAVEDEIGSPEKIVASKWAKLRWGVYDENPRSTDPSEYYLHSDLSTRPSICSSAIPGTNVKIDSPESSCNLQDLTGCRFEPSKEPQTEAFASLLYHTNLPYVNDFCDDESLVGRELAHDPEAPTTHNLHCRGQSIWSIMRSHPDFADGNNPPMSAEPPTTNFTIAQHIDRRVVLVLDVSTSMELDGKLELMHQAVSHYIDTVPVNTWVGIVCFGWQAQIKARLTEVRNDEVKSALKQRLLPNTVQGTSIGSGIMKALEVLAESGPEQLRGSGGSIIILTDGREHNRPKINDTIPMVKETGVIVNTIALGSIVARDLEWLATVSGGKTHAASVGEFGIDAELQEAFLSHQENADVGTIPIISEEIRIPSNSTVENEFVIDNSIGRNTRITVFYNRSVSPLVSLESPGGTTYTQGQRQRNVLFTHDEQFKTINIRITDDAEVGTWKLILENEIQSDSMLTRVSVVSHQRDDEPLVVSPALLCRSFDFTGTEAVVIYAYLSKGELAVLSALVFAEITRPLSPSGIVDTRFASLRDDGLDPDVTANDGVYSAYFASFTLMGRYNVKVYASDNDGRATLNTDYVLGIGKLQNDIIRHDTRYLLPTPRPRVRRSDDSPSRKKRAVFSLPPFQRVSSGAGAFVVQEWKVDGICSAGYSHFQDACYKVFSSPLLPEEAAEAVCVNEGGALSVVNSRQELAWLLVRITPVNNPESGIAWFGGVDKELRESGDLEIEKITSRVRRGMQDRDLDALTAIFIQPSESEDLISSFDPDINDMTNPEINRLISSLGLDSRRDLENLQNYATQFPNRLLRRKRQLTPGSTGQLFFPVAPGLKSADAVGATTSFPFLIDDTTTTYMTENSTNINDITLSPAKREPRVPDPLSSGADIPTCSWFQNEKIIESTGDICQSQKKFVCEKPIRDRLPPSRIVDLNVKVDENEKFATLTWSAPGDDLNKGKAEGYDIRTLRTRRARAILNSDFERGKHIDPDAIIPKTDFPSLSGSREEVVINITKTQVCPPNAVLDVIFALPPNVIPPNQNTEQREAIFQFMDELLSKFGIDEFEVQVAVLALTRSNQQIVRFDQNLNRMELMEHLTSGTSLVDADNRTISEAVTLANESGGRSEASKILIVITDEDKIEQFANLSIITMIISLNNNVEKRALWEVASYPPCMNSFIVDDVNSLSNFTTAVSMQMCQARITEYQAMAISAYDDEGHRGDPSNIIPFFSENVPDTVVCPELEPPPTPAPLATSNTATIIGVSIGIPFTLILAVLGSVMLFGQIKKYRKKRIEKKQREEEEKKIEEIRAARQQRAAAKAGSQEGGSDMTDIANKNNNNAKKFKLFGKWRIAPLNNPPV